MQFQLDFNVKSATGEYPLIVLHFLFTYKSLPSPQRCPALPMVGVLNQKDELLKIFDSIPVADVDQLIDQVDLPTLIFTNDATFARLTKLLQREFWRQQLSRDALCHQS